ncbi:MAG: glycosyltransferase family 1 protein, partial [Candidatus Aminicenantes bacterium]
MKIAVDCYEAGLYATGVGRVIENVLFSLAPMMPEDDFFVLSREPIKKFSALNIVPRILSKDRGYFWWQNGPFRRVLKKIQPDILIASNYTLPVFCRWKSLLIEHDVSFASHPEWYPPREVLKRKFLVQRSLRKAECVVAVSDFSKSELMKYFDIEPEKIKVVYHGVDDLFQRSPAAQIDEWKERRGLRDKKIVGYLGSIFNRRNIPVLVQSVARLREEQPDLVLYIIGKDMTHPPQDISRRLKKDWIRWEQTLDFDEIPLFYSSLDVFVYISEYEGFGLPPLEALACGTVSVLLNKSSLGEIYQGMGVMAEEPDVSQVTEALRTALYDEKTRTAV